MRTARYRVVLSIGAFFAPISIVAARYRAIWLIGRMSPQRRRRLLILAGRRSLENIVEASQLHGDKKRVARSIARRRFPRLRVISSPRTGRKNVSPCGEKERGDVTLFLFF
ncbi:hypothetical protein BHM03_00050651 [Ensete ventricosum]|nr:hypothetical protein BHM03_00050651 [Ensete ventricosum]